MNKKMVAFLLVILLSKFDIQARCGSGAALAGGLIGGTILGAAIASSDRPREVVVVRDPQPSSIRALRRQNNELRNTIEDLNQTIDALEDEIASLKTAISNLKKEQRIKKIEIKGQK